MFAFFGLGAQELLILGLLAVPVLILTIFLLVRSSSGGDRMRALEHENRRLNEELDRREDRPA